MKKTTTIREAVRERKTNRIEIQDKPVKVYVRKAFQQYKKGDEIMLRNKRVVETLTAKGLITTKKPKDVKSNEAEDGTTPVDATTG